MGFIPCWYFLNNNGHYKNTTHIKLTLTIEIVPLLYQCPMSKVVEGRASIFFPFLTLTLFRSQYLILVLLFPMRPSPSFLFQAI